MYSGVSVLSKIASLMNSFQVSFNQNTTAFMFYDFLANHSCILPLFSKIKNPKVRYIN